MQRGDIKGAVDFLVKSDPKRFIKTEVGVDREVLTERDEEKGEDRVYDCQTGQIVFFERNIPIS